MSDDQRSSREVTSQQDTVYHGWFYRRLALPILALLSNGASPEQLAWSIAVGAVIGINPLLGSATTLCLAIATVFRLNIAASQAANYAVYPIQLALFLPFLDLGTRLFHVKPLPLKPVVILELGKHHPLNLIRDLWLWEWHALIVWSVFALIAAPLIAVAITPLLRRMLDRVKRRQSPVVAGH